MPTLERYSSFEEMENSFRKGDKDTRTSAKKKLTSIEEFAVLLRESIVPARTIKKKSSKK